MDGLWYAHNDYLGKVWSVAYIVPPCVKYIGAVKNTLDRDLYNSTVLSTLPLRRRLVFVAHKMCLVGWSVQIVEATI